MANRQQYELRGSGDATPGEGFSQSAFDRLEKLQKEQISLIRKQATKKWKVVLAVMAFVILVGTCLATISIGFLRPKLPFSNESKEKKLPALSPLLQALPVSQVLSQSLDGIEEPSEPLRKYYFNVGLSNDHLLQECQGPHLKRSFPDMDYALLGYNILKGFPLSVGHDPGFTLPIFSADYRAGSQTADCRYSVPRGIILIPDVACITSFSSEVVETKYEFTKSLEVSANVEGGGWGVSFSASAGYKESSSEVSTGESVFILSRAGCNYYYMRLLEDDAPPFHPLFLQWVIELNNTNDDTVYVDFLERYGTHFLKEVKFGASFTYEHKMTSTAYKTEQEKGVNVAVSASYSGLFSVGGGFNMDSKQREAASDFRKKVETRTITIGAAPPSNGDALTWASTVKESPVPISYDLASIEELFTEKIMGRSRIPQYVIDYDSISKRIRASKRKYCEFLQSRGLVDACADLSPGITMQKTRLMGDFHTVASSSIGKCVDACYKTNKCIAVTFCTKCSKYDGSHNICYMYEEIQSAGDQKYAGQDSWWDSVVIVSKIKQQAVFENTAVNGVERSLKTPVTTLHQCFAACLDDLYCAVFSFCECPDKDTHCTLYSEARLSLIEESGTSTHFISRHDDVHVNSVYPTARP